MEKWGIVIIAMPSILQNEFSGTINGYRPTSSDLLKNEAIILFDKILVCKTLVLEVLYPDSPSPTASAILQGEGFGQITTTKFGK